MQISPIPALKDLLVDVFSQKGKRDAKNEDNSQSDCPPSSA